LGLWVYDKPSDSNDFLRDFYDEIISLINSGIDVKNKSGVITNKTIILDMFCCDVPAKSFILKIKGHSGFYSCTRCCTEGEYLNRRVCFPDVNCSKGLTNILLTSNKKTTILVLLHLF